MSGIKIVGTGMYVPKIVATNEDFSKIVETSDEWIRSRTGIAERHLSEGEPTWFMGLKAAEEALENAGTKAEEIDMIIHTSVSADYFFPSMACMIQGKLGAVNAFGLDINCACAAFVYALDMANRYIACGDVKTVLIVGSENLSKTVDYTDRATCVLFGDGAGAVVVTAGEKPLYSYLGSEGAGADKVYAHSILPDHAFIDPEKVQEYQTMFPQGKGFYTYMDGKEVYKFATRVMPLAVTEACKKAGIAPADLDVIVPHQANERIIKTAASNLKLPLDKFYINIARYGNTSSASIPICLYELHRQGLIQRGQMICVVGFGSGLTYGAAVFEF